MSDVVIEREDGAEGGRYVIRLDGHEAELTYRRVGRGLVSADHTFVPPEMRGGGIALKLVERLIADARAGSYRIRPRCSYVAAQFQRHPDWADLKED
jgi:predicted GNAT family acetyltransferase